LIRLNNKSMLFVSFNQLDKDIQGSNRNQLIKKGIEVIKYVA